MRLRHSSSTYQLLSSRHGYVSFSDEVGTEHVGLALQHGPVVLSGAAGAAGAVQVSVRVAQNPHEHAEPEIQVREG